MKTVPIVIVSVRPQGVNTTQVVDLSETLLQLTYEDQENKPDKLKLRIENGDLRNFDEPIWAFGNFVFIQWGYADVMTPQRKLQIRKVTGFRELTIECEGMELVLDRIMEPEQTYAPQKRSDVARTIAAKWGYVADDTVHIQDTDVIREAITQKASTDADFLRSLARKEGYEWYIDWDGFHFHKPNFFGQRKHKTYYWRGTDTDAEIIDIRVEMDVTKRAGSAQVVPGNLGGRGSGRGRIQFIDINYTGATQEDIDKLMPIVMQPGMLELDIPGVREIAQHKIVRVTEADQKSFQKAAITTLEQARRGVVKLEMTVIGDPNLYAKSVIFLDGVGARLTGAYYVTAVRHSIGKGYTCEVECRTDGAGGKYAASQFSKEANAITGAGIGVSGRVARRKDEIGLMIDGKYVTKDEFANGQVTPSNTNPRKPDRDSLGGVQLTGPTTTAQQELATLYAQHRLDPPIRQGNTAFVRGLVYSGDGYPRTIVPPKVIQLSDYSWAVVPGVDGAGQKIDDGYTYYQETGETFGVFGTEAQAVGARRAILDAQTTEAKYQASDEIGAPLPRVEQIDSPYGYNPNATQTPTYVYDSTPEHPIGDALKVGNIDLRNRPVVTLPDGSTATTLTTTVPVNQQVAGKQETVWYVLQGVTLDGRVLENDNQVFEYYQQTGLFFGVYDSQDKADKAAEMIHQNQEKYPPNNILVPSK